MHKNLVTIVVWFGRGDMLADRQTDRQTHAHTDAEIRTLSSAACLRQHQTFVKTVRYSRFLDFLFQLSRLTQY